MASKDKAGSTSSEAKDAETSGQKSKTGKYNLRRKTLVVRKETEERLVSPKTPKPKSRPPPLSKYRRRAANSRERGRMQEINIAFKDLQTVLPIHCLPEIDPKTGITKITTLRLAVNYIAALRDILGEDGSCSTANSKTSELNANHEDSGRTSEDPGTLVMSKGESLMNSMEKSEHLEEKVNTCSSVSEQNSVDINSSLPATSSDDQAVNVCLPAEQTLVYNTPAVAPVFGNSPVEVVEDNVQFPGDYSVNSEPRKQDISVEHSELHQTETRYSTTQGISAVSNVDSVQTMLANNSEIHMMQSNCDENLVHRLDIGHITDINSAEKDDINLNIDGNNNVRDFKPSSLPFQGPDVPFKNGNHHIDIVSAGLSWVDPEGQICSMDTDSAMDVQDDEMDIDTDLLVYPDIIRAVINDQFD